MNALQAVAIVGVGVVGIATVVSSLPASRRLPLARRLRPYLGALGPRRSALLDDHGSASGVVQAMLAPVVEALGARVQHAIGDHGALRDRLAAAGRDETPTRFRSQQVTWALGGFVGGVGLTVLASHRSPRSARASRSRSSARCGATAR
jgi:tight adherence protein C